MTTESTIPKEVVRYENINYYILVFLPFFLLFIVIRDELKKSTINSVENLLGTVLFLIVVILITFGVWKLLLLVTRKRNKILYCICVLMSVIDICYEPFTLSNSVDMLGITWTLIFLVVNIYSLYLLVSKNFRNYIFS
jgi:hypothetical protein